MNTRDIERFNLDELSDEELFFLDEFRYKQEIISHRYDMDEIERILSSLEARDFFSFFRITLVRAYRDIDAGKLDEALSQLIEFNDRYRRFFHRFNPPIINRFAISLYRLIGDTLLERNPEDIERASYFYLAILELRELTSVQPFSLLPASSRIIKGTWLKFRSSKDKRYLELISDGIDYFHLALNRAYFEKALDHTDVSIEGQLYQLPKDHYFLEISREVSIIQSVFKEIHHSYGTGRI